MKLAAGIILLAGVVGAQQLPEPPARNSVTAALNAANVSSSFFVASAMWYGAHQCVVREELKRNPKKSFWKALAIAAPFDIAVGIASWNLRSNRGAALA